MGAAAGNSAPLFLLQAVLGGKPVFEPELNPTGFELIRSASRLHEQVCRSRKFYSWPTTYSPRAKPRRTSL